MLNVCGYPLPGTRLTVAIGWFEFKSGTVGSLPAASLQETSGSDALCVSRLK